MHIGSTCMDPWCMENKTRCRSFLFFFLSKQTELLWWSCHLNDGEAFVKWKLQVKGQFVFILLLFLQSGHTTFARSLSPHWNSCIFSCLLNPIIMTNNLFALQYILSFNSETLLLNERSKGDWWGCWWWSKRRWDFMNGIWGKVSAWMLAVHRNSRAGLEEPGREVEMWGAAPACW